MPKQEPGEPLSKFIGRFMKAKKDKKWPLKQRLAVAYSESRKRE
jgi:hypothetical protein